MLIDEVKINVKAGRGGNGAVSFRHEKYVNKGGPDGGDGGDGGNIIIKSQGNADSLNEYKHQKNYSAENGQAGARNKRHGKNGQDLTLIVPPGTIVSDLATNRVLVDLGKGEKEFVVAKGGKGGLGNVHFATSTHQTPREFKPGEAGEELDLKLEMKMIADVGLIGLPNAGKSTLISTISNARPKIADYPFTTLEPVLGVTNYSNKSFVVCDIPGLVEGAAGGKGLGDKFLKHIERTKVLLHLIDSTSTNPERDYQTVRKELTEYSESLSNKKELIILTKIDACQKMPTGFKYDLAISSSAHKNIDKLLELIAKQI